MSVLVGFFLLFLTFDLWQNLEGEKEIKEKKRRKEISEVKNMGWVKEEKRRKKSKKGIEK